MSTRIVKEDEVSRYWLNKRFFSEYMVTDMLFHVQKKENRIIDYKTGEVIVTHVDFRTDIKPIGGGALRLSDYKLWMQKASCQAGSERKQSMAFNDLKHHIQYAEK
jgi:hypothetical protein